MNVGMEKGFFARHNLKIEYASFAGSAKIQQAMIADAIDIAVSAGPEFPFLIKAAAATGQAYAIGICAMAGPPLLLGVGVRPDSPIKSAKDMKGAKVSVSTAGGLTDWLPKELARQQGWPPDSIQTVPVGEVRSQIMALKTKQVDGNITSLSVIWDLEEKNEARLVVKFGEIVPDFIMHVIYASHKFEQKNPDALKRFLAAWFETIRYMRANREETMRIAQPVMRVPMHIVGRSYDEMMAMFSNTGKFEPKAVDVLARSFVELGMLDSKPDLSKHYTEKYLPVAVGQ
jgi:NitT/TauT family transport system substrate-binding protein